MVLAITSSSKLLPTNQPTNQQTNHHSRLAFKSFKQADQTKDCSWHKNPHSRRGTHPPTHPPKCAHLYIFVLTERAVILHMVNSLVFTFIFFFPNTPHKNQFEGFCLSNPSNPSVAAPQFSLSSLNNFELCYNLYHSQIQLKGIGAGSSSTV